MLSQVPSRVIPNALLLWKLLLAMDTDWVNILTFADPERNDLYVNYFGSER